MPRFVPKRVADYVTLLQAAADRISAALGSARSLQLQESTRPSGADPESRAFPVRVD